MCKIWSLVIQRCRVLLPSSPLDVCLLLILHLSQQVDWASVTSYIYIYTCTQHQMYPPNKIIKQTKKQLPFHHFKCLSYKNLHDSPLKSLHGGIADRCEICSRFGSVLALGVDMECSLIPWRRRGAWGWAYLSPPSIKNGPFSMKLLFYYYRYYYFFKFTLCWKKSNWLQTLASAGPTIRKKHWSANAYLLSSNLERRIHLNYQ